MFSTIFDWLSWLLSIAGFLWQRSGCTNICVGNEIAFCDVKSHLHVSENVESTDCWMGTHGLPTTAMIIWIGLVKCKLCANWQPNAERWHCNVCSIYCTTPTFGNHSRWRHGMEWLFILLAPRCTVSTSHNDSLHKRPVMPPFGSKPTFNNVLSFQYFVNHPEAITQSINTQLV